MTCKSIAMIAALCAGAFACHPTPAPSAGPTTVYVNDGTAAAQPAAQPAPAAAAQPAPAAAAQPAPAAAPAAAGTCNDLYARAAGALGGGAIGCIESTFEERGYDFDSDSCNGLENAWALGSGDFATLWPGCRAEQGFDDAACAAVLAGCFQ